MNPLNRLTPSSAEQVDDARVVVALDVDDGVENRLALGVQRLAFTRFEGVFDGLVRAAGVHPLRDGVAATTVRVKLGPVLRSQP